MNKNLLRSLAGLLVLIIAIGFIFLQQEPTISEPSGSMTAEEATATQAQGDRLPEIAPEGSRVARQGDASEEAAVDESLDSTVVPRYTIPRFSQSENIIRNNPDDWFEEANILAKAGQPETIYLEQVHGLLDLYALAVKEGGYPTGLNVEITNALLGKNSKRIALLAQSHPRINDEGELIDSWGTPYHFHHESMREVSIRSAGADKTFYSDDDFVYGTSSGPQIAP